MTYGLFKDKKTNKTFWVFNTHVDHVGEQARTKGIELIISKKNENIMGNYKQITCLLILLFSGTLGFAQDYKAGDRAEALIDNVWQEVKIIKVITGKSRTYEVLAVSGKTPVLEISRNTIRPFKLSQVSTMKVMPDDDIHLGKYELFSGIPPMYIGHIYLMPGGKYKVAFGTDEDNYEFGAYTYNSNTKSIQWMSGLFKNKGWTGKMTTKPGGGNRIEFNKATYAEAN